MEKKFDTMLVLYYELFHDDKGFHDVVFEQTKGKMALYRRLALMGIIYKFEKFKGDIEKNGIYTVKYHVPKNPFGVATAVVVPGIG